MAGYFAYPADPIQRISQPPLAGSSVKAVTYTFDPVAPGVNANPLWQEVNKALGGTLDIIYTPAADYQQKFATTIAGGDLPDLIAIRPPVQQLPALLKAKFTDLTPHLSGDAVSKYPNLAGIPTASWQETVINGSIWGVPMSRPAVGSAMVVRKDILDSYSLPLAPTNYIEFKTVLTELTNDRAGRWAAGDFVGMHDYIRTTYGLHGGWSENGGTFTHEYETPEYEASLADVKELADLGIFHPDMVGSSNNVRNEWFLNGKAPMAMVGFTGWPKFLVWGADIPGFEMAGMLPFSHDGTAEPTHSLANPAPHFTAITTADGERVEELLRVLDWLAAPFGSTEYLLRNYGTENVTYSLDGPNPVLNSRGQNLRLVPFKYITDAAQVIYQPSSRADAQAQFDYQEKALKLVGSWSDPTAGLYSETEAAKSTQLTTKADETRADIVLGRKPLSAWKDFLTEWKSGGGDKIRAEYQDGFQQTTS
jgi:putative aldouronate transport system substrate-binding protein